MTSRSWTGKIDEVSFAGQWRFQASLSQYTEHVLAELEQMGHQLRKAPTSSRRPRSLRKEEFKEKVKEDEKRDVQRDVLATHAGVPTTLLQVAQFVKRLQHRHPQSPRL